MLREAIFSATIVASGALQASEPVISLSATVKSPVSAVWTAWREQLKQWHVREDKKRPN
jgi:hypothetical protein